MRPEVNAVTLDERLATRTDWDPEGGPPAAMVKMRPVGRTTGGGSLPAGSTVSTTVAICGELSAVAEVTRICP